MITLYNTLTRTKTPFTPATPGVVRMFVCGPTVYDYSHVGHAKTYTQFDFLARYLRFRGYQVTYAQNITDIDDKIIRRAQETNLDPAELARRFEAAYFEDMDALGNTSVDVYARAHDYIDHIVEQVQTLITRGNAYQLPDGWYFDLTTFGNYGKLSRRTEVADGDSVSRIDENRSKRNPGDFALWKARKEGEPFWETPLGPGRPGWHIEDTAITEALFGPQYDLHGGAVDLIFPHHEAEIAQMESASGKEPLAAYWLHAGLMQVDGAKMGKSTGNFLTIRQALADTDFRTLRYAFLAQHYRSSMELNASTLEQAAGARRRVENFARTIDVSASESPESIQAATRAREQIIERLDDDLDTPGALAVLFTYIRDQHRSSDTPGKTAAQVISDVNTIFNAFDIEDATTHDSDAATIEAMLEKRQEARTNRDFATADQIRDDLTQRGIIIEDTPQGTRWWRK